MKNLKQILAAFLIVTSGLLNAQNIKNGQIIKNVNGLNIIIDKRMEMLSIIQYLAGSELISVKKISYVDSINKYFEPFKKHKAVELCKEMEKKGFNADAPVALMLYLNSDFKIVKKIDEYIIKRAKGEDKINEFVKVLQDFNTETNFDKFFSDNYTILYQSMKMLIDSNFKNFNEIKTIERFYGYKQNSYNIILVALSGAGYGPRIDAGNGRYDVYNIVGFSTTINKVPAYRDEQIFKYMVWHEFSHSFVNQLVDKYYKEFEKYKSLENPILSMMSKIGYPRWDVILYEHIVRAITTTLTFEKYGKEKAEKALKGEKDQGFIYIDSLYSKILNYSQNKNGRSFDQFFPELINVIKNYFENPIDFKYIPTCGQLFSQEGDYIVIYSTNEKNDSLNKSIKKYVEKLNKDYYEFPIENIITDTVALKRNLKDYSIFCYGSINGNLWLQSKIKDLPVQIYQDKLIALQTDNPNKFIIIYTAQNSEQALDFQFFHGPNNYVIANDKLEVIEMADYRYKDGKFYIEK